MSIRKQIRAAVQLQAAEDEWWNGLSPKQKSEYIKQHPRSKYAKQAKPSKQAPEKKAPVKKDAAPGNYAAHIKKAMANPHVKKKLEQFKQNMLEDAKYNGRDGLEKTLHSMSTNEIEDSGLDKLHPGLKKLVDEDKAFQKEYKKDAAAAGAVWRKYHSAYEKMLGKDGYRELFTRPTEDGPIDRTPQIEEVENYADNNNKPGLVKLFKQHQQAEEEQGDKADERRKKQQQHYADWTARLKKIMKSDVLPALGVKA